MILDDIVAAKKKRLVRHKENVSEQDMKNLALNEKRVPISFYNALRKQGLSIIGEFKKASPSHGKMNNKIELTDRIDQYNNAVDAISCLTEEDYFLGNTDYLKQIRKITNLPIIRKDFIIDEYQVQYFLLLQYLTMKSSKNYMTWHTAFHLTFCAKFITKRKCKE